MPLLTVQQMAALERLSKGATILGSDDTHWIRVYDSLIPLELAICSVNGQSGARTYYRRAVDVPGIKEHGLHKEAEYYKETTERYAREGSRLYGIIASVASLIAPLGERLGVKSINGERVDETVKRVVDAAMFTLDDICTPDDAAYRKCDPDSPAWKVIKRDTIPCAPPVEAERIGSYTLTGDPPASLSTPSELRRVAASNPTLAPWLDGAAETIEFLRQAVETAYCSEYLEQVHAQGYGQALEELGIPDNLTLEEGIATLHAQGHAQGYAQAVAELRTTPEGTTANPLAATALRFAAALDVIPKSYMSTVAPIIETIAFLTEVLEDLKAKKKG